MRTFTLLFSALVLSTTATKAQTVATFEDITLPKADTFYVNYSAPGADVGFNDGGAHFPCIYDTAYGGIWSTGFAYSNMTDSVTSGSGNEYSAKTAAGYSGSQKYAVAYCSNPVTYANNMTLNLLPAAMGSPVNGFFLTNNTYAYNSMRDGDFFAKKFGRGDWFLLTVKGYSGGVLQTDSVNAYLADFLLADTTKNYILNTWQWVNLLPLGNVDSLQFSLTSSDNGTYGMNTPAYFCMDNLITTNKSLSVNTTPAAIAKVYPNPATNMLYVDVTDRSLQKITMTDIAGHVISTYTITGDHTGINTSSLPAGMYLLQLSGNDKTASVRFTKQ